jgi:hypothetical protein
MMGGEAMKILSERKSVNVFGAVLFSSIVLFIIAMLVWQGMGDAALREKEAWVEAAEQSSRLQDQLIEAHAEYIEEVIGPMAASCYRATGGKWDPVEMVKHCGMTAEEAKRESMRYPKLLAKAESDEAKRHQKELLKLGKTK